MISFSPPQDFTKRLAIVALFLQNMAGLHYVSLLLPRFTSDLELCGNKYFSHSRNSSLFNILPRRGIQVATVLTDVLFFPKLKKRVAMFFFFANRIRANDMFLALLQDLHQTWDRVGINTPSSQSIVLPATFPPTQEFKNWWALLDVLSSFQNTSRA
jgi:hypothetical protein